MSNQVRNTPAARPAPGRRSIALDVAGGGLLLRGRFSDWESGLTLGPDLDKAGVRLVVDATSAGGADDEGEPLFTFDSRSVETAGEGAFVARGMFTGSGLTKPVEVMVETPPGHTALFVLSFAAEKSDFDDGWRDLVENVLPFSSPGEGAPARQARAWLTAPVLAAA